MPLSSYSSTKSLIDGIRVWGFPSGCAACLSARQAPDRYPCTPRFTGSMLLIRSIRTRDQSLCKQSRVTAALQCQSQWARICRRAPHVVNARVRDGDHYLVSNPMSTWLGVVSRCQPTITLMTNRSTWSWWKVDQLHMESATKRALVTGVLTFPR